MAEETKITTFRTDFPEFADVTAYPEAVLLFWYGIAEKQLIVARWADLYTYGLELCTAHYVALAKQNQMASAAGGKPGNASGGPISSQSVGDVSVSYDTQAGIEQDAGFWNNTNYGKQFIRLARMCGMGGYQF
jgi:hypothetical protein